MTTPKTLTRDDVLAMEAGPEMDRLVAERVMGWEAWQSKHGHWVIVDDRKQRHEPGILLISGEPHNRKWWKEYPPPRYSRDIGEAWAVYEAMLRKPDANRWILVRRAYGLPCAKWYWNDERPDVAVSAETMPLAICKAALLASLER